MPVQQQQEQPAQPVRQEDHPFFYLFRYFDVTMSNNGELRSMIPNWSNLRTLSIGQLKEFDAGLQANIGQNHMLYCILILLDEIASLCGYADETVVNGHSLDRHCVSDFAQEANNAVDDLYGKLLDIRRQYAFDGLDLEGKLQRELYCLGLNFYQD